MTDQQLLKLLEIEFREIIASEVLGFHKSKLNALELLQQYKEELQSKENRFKFDETYEIKTHKNQADEYNPNEKQAF